MYKQEEAISHLRDVVEIAIGRKMLTPKDFNFLSKAIFDKLHKSVSPTTLKRLWGYLSEPVIPRVSTLDIMAQFVGFKDWEDFCEHHAEAKDNFCDNQATQDGDVLSRPPTAKTDGNSSNDTTGDDEELVVMTKNTTKSFFSSHRIAFLSLVLLTFITASWALYSRLNPPSPQVYILAQGQKFKSFRDYLQLFGITDTAFYWGRPIPHHPNIAVWGPEHQHPWWHNYGDPKQMMPTITERWEPEGVDSSVVAMRNYDNYYHELRVNEVRLTFMKNLVDSGYVFLGVYRMSLEESDSTHCVWERVADECDLNNLDYLEKFRN